MRKNFGPKTWLFPMPVLIIGSYNDDGTPNAMVAAWGGIFDTNQIIICSSKEHRTTENIRKRNAFTVSFSNRDSLGKCDYIGIVSGNDIPGKVSNAGFTTVKSSFVDAPIINELPMTLECRVNRIIGDENIIGDILNISADEEYLDGKGLPDMGKISPVIFDPVRAEYRMPGSVLGKAYTHGDCNAL